MKMRVLLLLTMVALGVTVSGCRGSRRCQYQGGLDYNPNPSGTPRWTIRNSLTCTFGGADRLMARFGQGSEEPAGIVRERFEETITVIVGSGFARLPETTIFRMYATDGGHELTEGPWNLVGVMSPGDGLTHYRYAPTADYRDQAFDDWVRSVFRADRELRSFVVEGELAEALRDDPDHRVGVFYYVSWSYYDPDDRQTHRHQARIDAPPQAPSAGALADDDSFSITLSGNATYDHIAQ